MMVLQIISEKKVLLDEIADMLLTDRLLANAMISDETLFKETDTNGNVVTSTRYILKGVSKSLLFSSINTRLREVYGEKMPLLYSEPIIMLDPIQTEEILEKLAPV